MKVLYIALLLGVVLLITEGSSGTSSSSFKQKQMSYSRVKEAFETNEESIKELFRKSGLSYPPKKIFLRAFKKEQLLELWVEDKLEFKLLKTYKICANSGVLGPKRMEGDLQVPEGFYFIDVFNPQSKFHLSMRVNYPNESDRILGVKGHLGGDIYIHGDCVTIGCIPLTDRWIKELYVIAVEAKASSKNPIYVHIFPAKLNSEGLKVLEKDYSDNPKLITFWKNLKVGYDYFENHRRLPAISVDKGGGYLFSDH